MTDINFKDLNARAEYFKQTENRMPISEFIKLIKGMVAFVGPYTTEKDVFISDDICIGFWGDYPDQHRYFGHHLSCLVDDGKLPLIRVGTDGTRALYSIVF